MLCSRCKSGKLLSDNPFDSSSDWSCNRCDFQMDATNFQYNQNRLQFAIENIDRYAPYDFEAFLEKYCYHPKQTANGTSNDIIDSNILLHERNTFVLQVKYALTQLYGNVSGFLWHGTFVFHCITLQCLVFGHWNKCRVSSVYSILFVIHSFIHSLFSWSAEICETDIKRKISLCQELIQVVRVLEPGKSIFRGKLLVDLQEALFAETERRVSNGEMSKLVARVCTILYSTLH